MLPVWRARYLRSAATGQVEVFVAPTVMVHVLRNGSVLETLISSWAEACMRERSL